MSEGLGLLLAQSYGESYKFHTTHCNADSAVFVLTLASIVAHHSKCKRVASK